MEPQILFLGTAGPLSVEPLVWLINNGYAPRCVAVPAHLVGREPSSNDLPVARPLTTCAQVARRHDLELVGVTREWQDRLAEHPQALLLSACWPWRLTRHVLDAFPAGSYNLHPSLLPRFRGPAPLFWQLREGATQTGITLHRLTPALDDGPIVAQRTRAIGDHDTEDSLGTALGILSGAVLQDFLLQLEQGSVAVHAQDENESSYHPMPSNTDFTVPVHWSAQRAYRFIRGTAARGHMFQIDLGSRRIRVHNAIAYHPQRKMHSELETKDHCLRVRFGDGVVDLLPT